MIPEREAQLRTMFEAQWPGRTERCADEPETYAHPVMRLYWDGWLACARALEPKWQPIETAPKDGTEILLSRVSSAVDGKPVAPCVTSGAWIEWQKTASEYHGTTGEYLGQSVQDEGAGWASWNGGFADDAPPTHWMPLPEQPKAAMSAALEDGNANQ